MFDMLGGQPRARFNSPGLSGHRSLASGHPSKGSPQNQAHVPGRDPLPLCLCSCILQPHLDPTHCLSQSEDFSTRLSFSSKSGTVMGSGLTDLPRH